MRCFFCDEFCLLDFCDFCYEQLKDLELGCRNYNGFRVYSFYKFNSIKHILHKKHNFAGYFVYKFLANLSFKRFEDFFKLDFITNAIPLDDKVERLLYSHSAILARALKSNYIKPIYNAIKAQNNVKYQGQNLEFRQKNKRKYKLLKPIKHPVILVDDIITTGSSILEAKELLNKNHIETIFALVLADAKE